MFNRWKKKEFEIAIEDIILLREILILGEYGFRKLQKFFQITEMNVDFQKVPGNSYRSKKIYQQAATDSTQKAPPQVSLLSDFIGAAHITDLAKVELEFYRNILKSAFSIYSQFTISLLSSAKKCYFPNLFTPNCSLVCQTAIADMYVDTNSTSAYNSYQFFSGFLEGARVINSIILNFSITVSTPLVSATKCDTM